MNWVALRVAGIFLLVAVLAGGIAYLGNQLGRHIGRKKMSVWGMRPRHTSNFVTTMTGSGIAVVTLILFSIFSEPVRQLLTGTDVLVQRLEILKSDVKKLETKVNEGRVVYGVGEPILLGTLNPSLGAQRLRSQIVAALSAANSQALLHNNNIAAQKKEPPLDSDMQILQWNDSAIDGLVKNLDNQSEVLGIRIAAAQNCLYGDKVPVKLETMTVTRVFREGETVASSQLEPGQSQLREWYDFLDVMRTTALRKGMIAINDSLGGGLSPQDFDRVIAQLERLKGSGKLVAVAKRDLYQTSPLDVFIEVRPDVVKESSQILNRRPPLVTSRKGVR